MIPRDEWQWYGLAGHFICADRCLFHMTTAIGSVMVSTVGSMVGRDGVFEEIGAGRLYETMVFKLSGDICSCGCAAPIIDPSKELACDGYNDQESARKGHMAMCESWAKRERELREISPDALDRPERKSESPVGPE